MSMVSYIIHSFCSKFCSDSDSTVKVNLSIPINYHFSFNILQPGCPLKYVEVWKYFKNSFLIDSTETDISIVALLLWPKYFFYDWSVLHMSSEWFNFSFLLLEPYFPRRKKIFIGICLFRRLTQKKLFELTWILASVSPIFIASSSLK